MPTPTTFRGARLRRWLRRRVAWLALLVLALAPTSTALAQGADAFRPEARLLENRDVGRTLAGPRTTHLDPSRDLLDWHDDVIFRCRSIAVGTFGRSSDAVEVDEKGWLARLDDVVATVAREPSLGAPLLAVAALARVVICFDDRNEGVMGYFDRERGTIVIDASLTDAEAAVILVHELRHLERSRRGFIPTTEIALNHAATYKLALEADVQAVSALFAWRAADRGDEGPWEAYLGFDRYADIGVALGDVLLSGGTTVAALDAAFRQWWASTWRVDTYRFQALIAHLDAVDHEKRLEPARALTIADLHGLRVLPDGTPYGVSPVPVGDVPPPVR